MIIDWTARHVALRLWAGSGEIPVMWAGRDRGFSWIRGDELVSGKLPLAGGGASRTTRARAVLRTGVDEETNLALVEALPELQYDAEHLPGAVNLPGDVTADLAARLARPEPDSGQLLLWAVLRPVQGRRRLHPPGLHRRAGLHRRQGRLG